MATFGQQYKLFFWFLCCWPNPDWMFVVLPDDPNLSLKNPGLFLVPDTWIVCLAPLQAGTISCRTEGKVVFPSTWQLYFNSCQWSQKQAEMVPWIGTASVTVLSTSCYSAIEVQLWFRTLAYILKLTVVSQLCPVWMSWWAAVQTERESVWQIASCDSWMQPVGSCAQNLISLLSTETHSLSDLSHGKLLCNKYSA